MWKFFSAVCIGFAAASSSTTATPKKGRSKKGVDWLFGEDLKEKKNSKSSSDDVKNIKKPSASNSNSKVPRSRSTSSMSSLSSNSDRLSEELKLDEDDLPTTIPAINKRIFQDLEWGTSVCRDNLYKLSHAENAVADDIVAAVNKPNQHGRRILHEAVRKGDAILVSELINNYGADVHQLEEGLSSLQVATRTRNTKVLRVLIEQGAKHEMKCAHVASGNIADPDVAHFLTLFWMVVIIIALNYYF